MTEQQQKKLACELSAISVFREILNTKQMSSFIAFLSYEGALQGKLSLFGEFVYSLSEFDYSFSKFLSKAVFEDENLYIVNTAHSLEIPKAVQRNAKAELKLLSSLTKLDGNSLFEGIDFDGYIPSFENTETNLVTAYGERLANINSYGYGVFATAKMFALKDEKIVPVLVADDVSVDEFVGYERERKQVFDNTEALICGKPAANVLLFGDAGTGKSSTVKACANYYAEKGLRLIELRKDQLFALPYVMEKIAGNPLKFIIFIDDLSFNKNDDCFSMLKAVLEGSAHAKAKNAVIYATSNRRHIVKETFSGREGADDIHYSDTVQELMSLSDRFGLTVYFEKPNKSLYLDIVHLLAEKQGINIEKSELEIKAEAFALKKGSRSPRAAEQFVNSLM